MKLTTSPALDRLVVDARCLGAAFTTFTFDPAFFENHVLAAVLRLSADPDDATAAYHDEALATLQETPIVCFVDAKMRPSGHQLPYDLREIRGRVFHPKVALLLYEGCARLSVASGNLTEAGYGRNAETFFVHDLQYDEPEHAAVLRQVLEFFRRLDELATPKGTQTALVLDALARRIEGTPAPESEPFAFVHTEAPTGMLERVLALLPDKATITRVGVLAPFFERDDVSDDPGADLASVLLTLATRAGKDAVFDLGVSWEDAAIARTAAEPRAIRDGLETLWASRTKRDDEERIEYFVPTAETASNYRVIDAEGRSRLVPRSEFDEGVASGTAWQVGRPRVFAPRSLVAAAREAIREVRVWLYPTPQLVASRPIERPLHAKLLNIVFKTGSKVRTLVLVGSANASRMALLRTPSEGGNVEACVAFIVDGEETLRDLAPKLVHCAAQVEWAERTITEPPPLPSIPLVDAATYDPRTETLTVTWLQGERPVSEWTLVYQDTVLANGTGFPAAATRVAPFRLSASSCEVIVRAHDGERSFPILVDDLAALPLGTSAAKLGLRDLLALVGRRISVERHQTIQARHGNAMVDATLTSLLGEGFSPTDVFRAWWTVASDLAAEGLSVAGFRLRLLGTIGAAAIWSRLREHAGTPELRGEEAWFYGVELRRALRAVVPAPGPDQAAKQTVLDRYLETLSGELQKLEPRKSRGWVDDIVKFYEETQS